MIFIILWYHCLICGLSLTKMLLCNKRLYFLEEEKNADSVPSAKDVGLEAPRQAGLPLPRLHLLGGDGLCSALSTHSQSYRFIYVKGSYEWFTYISKVHTLKSFWPIPKLFCVFSNSMDYCRFPEHHRASFKCLLKNLEIFSLDGSVQTLHFVCTRIGTPHILIGNKLQNMPCFFCENLGESHFI